MSIAPGSPSTSAAPRTIWEKMTPELPRAPISAARVSSFATAARSAAVDASSDSTIARAVSVRFVPVSPSGNGIDVQVVDPAPVRLERRERPARQLSGALELRHADLLTSWMCTSTAATVRPVSRSTS